MRKTLLLLAFMAIVCIGCKDNSKNNGPDTPETPEEPDKPALGYIDFSNWYSIMLKDAATAQPLIKGTLLKDTTSLDSIRQTGETYIRYNKRILTYKEETACGIFFTDYTFNQDAVLAEIRSDLDSTVVLSNDDLYKHAKIISDQLHTYVMSYEKDRGHYHSFMFDLYKDGKYINGYMMQDLKKGEEPYPALWSYTDRKFKKGFAAGETVYSLQMWGISDPDVIMHQTETAPVMMFGTSEKGNAYITVQFSRM